MPLQGVTGAETDWVNQLLDKMLKINLDVAKLSRNAESKNNRIKNNLRLEPVKMPRFDGNIREYARFKLDFINQVCQK